MIRLHVEDALFPDVEVAVTPGQAHYLLSVMRRSAGDEVLLFNGRDGEWRGSIAATGRHAARVLVQAQTRTQSAEPDVWLAFALLKRDMTDLVVQKATELGVAALLPVITERTQAARVNESRLRDIAIEAAEQSERLTVPVLHPLRKLDAVLSDWPPSRAMYAAIERDAERPLAGRALAGEAGPVGLLVGPEGGFGPRDRALLRGSGFVVPVSLGPRILRAETAAIAGLALLQSGVCG